MLEHVRWLRNAVHGADAELLIAGDTLLALVRRGEWHGALHPRFAATSSGATVFSPQLHDAAEAFAGWLPYPVRQWPVAADRLLFKRTVQAAGLPTPAALLEAPEGTSHVVVKRSLRSAEHHVDGPFGTAAERPLDVPAGEYYEPFVPGDRLEVWYWHGAPVCAEMQRLPFVLGDGVSQLGELILHRASHSGPRASEDGEALFAKAEGFLRYLGTPMSTVIPHGVRQTVDFRHDSPLSHPSDRDTVDLSSAGDNDWMRLLRRTGEVLLATFPEAERAATLFTVELILDDRNRAWLIEASSNPFVHPLVYPSMVETLLRDAPQAGASPRSAAEPAAIAGAA
jgi:hypothetical protein